MLSSQHLQKHYQYILILGIIPHHCECHCWLVSHAAPRCLLWSTKFNQIEWNQRANNQKGQKHHLPKVDMSTTNGLNERIPVYRAIPCPQHEYESQQHNTYNPPKTDHGIPISQPKLHFLFRCMLMISNSQIGGPIFISNLLLQWDLVLK